MYSKEEIQREVRDVIGALENNQPIVQAWVTESVVGSHPQIEGPDKDFYLVCTYGYIRSLVAKEINRYKLSQEQQPDPQLLLPGFHRIQVRYAIEREGELIAIPVGQLTDSEIDAKIAELEGMALGCMEHAEELRRFKTTPRAA